MRRATGSVGGFANLATDLRAERMRCACRKATWGARLVHLHRYINDHESALSALTCREALKYL